jgi:hypothetical protein
LTDIESSTKKEGQPVIIDTGRCRAELHPVYGVILIGTITSVEIDGQAVFIPAR